jgi:hypothetical protein
VLNPNVGVQPVVAFEPLPDPVLTVEGSESEGSSGFSLSPSKFPAGLNHGVFIGFHGLFDEGGIANDENPMVFANPSTGHYFDFISNDLPNIGHLDEMLSTTNSLFVADISSTGELFGPSGVGAGKIYQIEAIAASTAAVSIGAHSLTGAGTRVHQGMGDLSSTKSKATAPATSTVHRRVSNFIHEIDAARSHRHRKGEKGVRIGRFGT